MLPAMRMTGPTLLGWVLTLALTSSAAEYHYRFDGEFSREVLDNFLSRAVTFTDFLHRKGSVTDNLRFLTNTGAKFVGRAIYRWGGEDAPPALLAAAQPIARQARAADPDIILQAACFEIATTNARSAATPEGFNQEETTKGIWAKDRSVAATNPPRQQSVNPGAEGAVGEAGLFAGSLVSPGDPARLQHAFAKARRGQPVAVGVIGGSITAGAGASQPERRYGDHVATWWRQTFPKATVHFVNAGIGATGSDYGALRAKRDLLSDHPDFVVVEYAVNGPNTRVLNPRQRFHSASVPDAGRSRLD
jgi:hypothetical protein